MTANNFLNTMQQWAQSNADMAKKVKDFANDLSKDLNPEQKKIFDQEMQKVDFDGPAKEMKAVLDEIEKAKAKI